MVTKRKSSIQHDESRVGGDESATYVIPNDAICRCSLILQTSFGLVLEQCILQHVHIYIFLSYVGFSIKTVLWVWCLTMLCSSRASAVSRKVVKKEDDGRVQTEFCVFLFQIFFICNLETCCDEFNRHSLHFSNLPCGEVAEHLLTSP
jgi:hypothetical protein